MSARTALVTARSRALTRMVDRGSVWRPSSSGALDPVTGIPALGAAAAPIWSGPCFLSEKRVQNPSARPVAGDFPFEEVATLSLPSDVPQIDPLDVFVLESAPDHPQDVGRRFKVISFNPSTQVKARQFQMAAIIG